MFSCLERKPVLVYLPAKLVKRPPVFTGGLITQITFNQVVHSFQLRIVKLFLQIL